MNQFDLDEDEDEDEEESDPIELSSFLQKSLLHLKMQEEWSDTEWLSGDLYMVKKKK